MKRTQIVRLLVVVFMALLSWAPGTPVFAQPSPFDIPSGSGAAQADFNGDGFADLAIGVPMEDVSLIGVGFGLTDAGAVNVIYGSANGLTAIGNQFLTENALAITLEGVETGDQFGAALAVGFFNDDLFADLAVGAPKEDVRVPSPDPSTPPIQDVGNVVVFYGWADGIDEPQVWSQDSAGIGGGAEAGDQFGASLAAGDFDGDGRDDLAVGVPFEDLNGTDTGAVNIIYGDANGLSAFGNQVWSQSSSGISGTADRGDLFGFTLAAGNFDGDSFDDLAIGVPFENRLTVVDAGAVNVLYGTNVGLSATGSQFWHQGVGSILDQPEGDDLFGVALAAGDFDADNRDDLAIGAPGEENGVGGVNVIYGTVSGLSDVGNQFWHQNATGILDVAEAGDRFGAALAAADFDHDLRDDLAVGAPFEDTGPAETDQAGAVNVIYGTTNGLQAAGNQFWHKDLLQGTVTVSDRFGFALVPGDFDDDNNDDLAVAVPFDNIGGGDAGVVYALYGVSSSGLSATGSQVWSQNSPGILDQAEVSDQFGLSMP
jgi:hypothetical protein